MGCDIHGWVECDFFGAKQQTQDPAWYPHIRIDMLVERNYKLFGRLFGVRGTEEKALFANRGLPEPDKYHEDSVRDNEYKSWSEDAHSPTYVSWNELKEHSEELISMSGQGWQTLFNMMEELAKLRGSKNVRLVVWFDN